MIEIREPEKGLSRHDDRAANLKSESLLRMSEWINADFTQFKLLRGLCAGINVVLFLINRKTVCVCVCVCVCVNQISNQIMFNRQCCYHAPLHVLQWGSKKNRKQYNTKRKRYTSSGICQAKQYVYNVHRPHILKNTCQHVPSYKSRIRPEIV